MSYAKKSSSKIIDFGDPNVQNLKTRFRALAVTDAKKSGQLVTITQFGDSHTAADFFTGEFRTLIQKRYGNAGIGWITPISIKGQYHTAVKWQASNWDLMSSQTSGLQAREFDFPMGGFMVNPASGKEVITLVPNLLDQQLWQVKVLFKHPKKQSSTLSLHDANGNKINISQPIKNNGWQLSTAKVAMPMRIESRGRNELGGIWLLHDNPTGVLVSAIGVNGAKQSIWQKWNEDWFFELAESKTDLVILAYGANESFDMTLNLQEYKMNLMHNIDMIRKVLPSAVILLISPPDTLMDENHIAPLLNEIKSIQFQVAKSKRTLLWDWQQAMGGKFTLKHWLKKGLAKPDLVHQTAKGYQVSAKIFYTDFIEFIQKR